MKKIWIAVVGCSVALVCVLAIMFAGIGVVRFLFHSSDNFRDDPAQRAPRIQQIVGRWDSPVVAPRNEQFSWIFAVDGHYEFKQDFHRPANALSWYYTEDKGTWKFVGVDGNRVKLSLDPGTFGSEVVFELPLDPHAVPTQIDWWKYSDIDYRLRAYPLQATAVDDDRWKQ